MHAIRERNIDRVDPRLVQQLVVGPVRVGNVVLLRVFLGLLEGARGDGGDDDAPMTPRWVDDSGIVDQRSGEKANTECIGLFVNGIMRLIKPLTEKRRELQC